MLETQLELGQERMAEGFGGNAGTVGNEKYRAIGGRKRRRKHIGSKEVEK
jgi:hypothetical protein